LFSLAFFDDLAKEIVRVRIDESLPSLTGCIPAWKPMAQGGWRAGPWGFTREENRTNNSGPASILNFSVRIQADVGLVVRLAVPVDSADWQDITFRLNQSKKA